MSLVNLAHAITHVRNCSMVNIGHAAIPYTRLHLQIASGLYKEGFITSIQRGSVTGPDEQFTHVTPDNVATRRLWLTLKYRNNESVIQDIQLVSKPNRRINLNANEIKALASGISVRLVKPLQPAECMFVRVRESKEVVEIQEAAQRGLEGEVICRVN